MIATPAYRYQLEAFVDMVRGREPAHWVTLDSSIAQMDTIDMVYEKSGLGKRLPVLVRGPHPYHYRARRRGCDVGSTDVGSMEYISFARMRVFGGLRSSRSIICLLLTS